MWLLASVACTPDVLGLYEQERNAALTAATERPADWQPDVRVAIAEDDLEVAVGAALRAALADPEPFRVSLPLGLSAELRPRVNVEKASVKASGACPSCLGFDAAFAGRAAWTLGSASGTLPFEVAAEGVFAVVVEGGSRVTAQPRSVGSVRVKLSDYDELRVNPSKDLQEWARATLAKELEPIALVDLGGAGLPVRDLRLITKDGVTVEVLTDVPGATPAGPAEPVREGVRVQISETALAGLARRAAYTKGELAMDVSADPRAIAVEGSDFTLSLRLWRLTGRGWWRDYEITGQLGIDRGRLVLTPSAAREVAQSRGAGLVDPLVALFEGKVLEALTDALTRSLPASRDEDLGAVRLQAVARRVSGHAGTVTLDGTLGLKAPREK